MSNALNSENKILDENRKRFIIVGVLFTFLLSFTLSMYLNSITAPDEETRFLLSLWIYKNNRLPYGNEAEIINQYWGMSYAYRPYLISLFSAINMKIVSLFTDSEMALLTAARFPNVISHCLLFVISYFIGIELFKDKYLPELFSLVITYMPQVIFLGCYINMDGPSLTESAAIIYIWVLGYRKGFTWRRCIVLGVIIGISILTYYNIAPFIILSIPVCLYSVLVNERCSVKDILYKALLTASSSAVVSGGWLIRNAVIYNGDFLGLKTENYYRELNAIDSLKPSNIYNGVNTGKGMIEYYFPYGILNPESWFGKTWRSMIGVFGYLNFRVWAWIYILFLVLIVVGGIAYILRYVISKNERDRLFVVIILFMACILPWIISMYQSWSRDYQPQGRYVISCIVPLAIICFRGISFLINRALSVFFMKKVIHIECYIRILICVFFLWISISSILLSLGPHCLNTDYFIIAD